MTNLDSYLDRFSESGKSILQAAFDESVRRNQNLLFPEHILYALLSEESTLFTKTMNSLLIDSQALRLAIEKRLENSGQYTGKEFRIAPETIQIFKYSMDRARSQGRRVIDVADIFYVLAANRDNLLDDILQNPAGFIQPFNDIRRIETHDKPSPFDEQLIDNVNRFSIGSIVEFDGLLAVIVGLSGENGIPYDHLSLWFGEPQGERKSKGGGGDLVPIVRTVPSEYCLPAKPPIVRH